jgi:glucose-1-phosphate cytidylyltransferase
MTVMLAGGRGTRLAEETEVRPKPMVEIGGRPMIWHIMKLYSVFGIREFLLALGYRGDFIKHYFLDYRALNGSFRLGLQSGSVELYGTQAEDWDVHLMDTGIETNTGGRLLRLREYLKDGTFMLTYGDGLGDVDIEALLALHRRQGRIATITAVRPPARFGGLEFDGDLVARFSEKPQAGEGWINGGFMVFEPAVFDYLDGDASSLESEALDRLAKDGQLAAYRHPGYWQCMDTIRDKMRLEEAWAAGKAPWKLWT